MTTTLQDVAVLLGLQIDDLVITGRDDKDWTFECERLLGRVPPQTTIGGGEVKLLLAQRPITLVLMMINSCSYSTNDLVFN